MCLILFASGTHTRFPLIVAANRDEAYVRPSAPAHFWNDAPAVYAGRDLEQGGTWLGLTRSGRFAAITNYRQAEPRRAGTRSRGDLTRAFLTGTEHPERYLARVAKRAGEYNGFSLIVGTPGELYFYSNRGSEPAPIAPGVHGLSNHLLDEPWPKVLRGIDALEAVMDKREADITAALAAALADREPAPDDFLRATGANLERDRLRSAAFIPDDAYGTRASTIVLVGAEGDVLFRESRFGPRGEALGTHEERFVLEGALRRDRQSADG
jgi:uncharacterized protein with NRDE domain